MPALIIYIISASFYDGVSTSQQALILILLLASAKPVRNSIAYTIGISAAYIACGITGLFLADTLNAMVREFFPNLMNISSPSYYRAQMAMGIILFISGPVYLLFKLRSRKKRKENRFASMISGIRPLTAFIIGAFISLSSFPVSLPYITAIEKIAVSVNGKMLQSCYILLYNIVYILPVLLPFIVYLVLRGSIEGIEKKLHFHIARLNVILTLVMLSGMGLLIIADSASYFIRSVPLFSNRMFM
ncbi:MAG: GAP family protein [Brevinematales bacterium]|jgi:cytochrome c biogenesis protein CcdA